MKILIPARLFGITPYYKGRLCVSTDIIRLSFIYNKHAFMSGSVSYNGKVYETDEIPITSVNLEPIKIENSTYGLEFYSRDKYKEYLKLKLKY